MTEFLQQVVSGLASGGVYGSLALAVVIIYRSTGVVNFAQGEMATLSTFVCWTLMDHGVAFWPAFALTLVLSFLGGIAIETAFVRPVEGAPTLAIVILTIGLLIAINGLTTWIWGGAAKPFDGPFSTEPIDVGGVRFSKQDLGVIVVSLIAVGLMWLLFSRTKLGLGLRATAVNRLESRLVGVRVGWMLAVGWGLAAVLGAVAGVMAAPSLFLDPNMMQTVLLYAFAAAILGGLDSPVGAVVGGLILGLTIDLLGRYVGWIGSTLKLPVALALILGFLLFKPAGLFGKLAVRRV